MAKYMRLLTLSLLMVFAVAGVSSAQANAPICSTLFQSSESGLTKSSVAFFTPGRDGKGPVINALVRYGVSAPIGSIVKVAGKHQKIAGWGADKDGRGFVRVTDMDGSAIRDVPFDTLPKGAFALKAIQLDDVMKYRNELVIDRIVRDHPGISREKAISAFEEMKKWFFWKYRAYMENLDQRARPYMYDEIDTIDYAWHAFLLFTDHYADFGKKYFSTFLHHTTQSALDERDGVIRAPENELSGRDAYVYRDAILAHMRETLGEETYQRWFVRLEFNPH